MLVMWGTLPITNEVITKDLEDFITCLDFGSIADEFIHGTMLADGITKGVYELFGGFHTVNTGVECIDARIELSTYQTIIDCRRIRVESVCCLRGTGTYTTSSRYHVGYGVPIE